MQFCVFGIAESKRPRAFRQRCQTVTTSCKEHIIVNGVKTRVRVMINRWHSPRQFVRYRLVIQHYLQLLIIVLDESKSQLLRKSLNCGIASKIRIAGTPTNVYNRTYIFWHVYNSNFEQPIRFLLAITIKRRLAV